MPYDSYESPGYGSLSVEQSAALLQYVSGKTVHDLGAGNCALSRVLVSLGAEHVVAVDKSPRVIASTDRQRLTYVACSFDAFMPPIDTAFVSWPINVRYTGLAQLIARSRVVAYLGKNSDGVACGEPSLFTYLREREVLAYVPHQHNSLIVYGPGLVERDPLGDEVAALDVGNPWWYRKIEAWNAGDRA